MSVDPSKIKAGKAGRRASPWGKYPHCETPRAIRLFGHAKKQREAAEAIAAMRKGNKK